MRKQSDQIIFWYRGWPKAITCSTGSPPRNADYPADAVFALALLSSPATVELYIGSNSASWDAPAGASMGSVPFPTEDSQIPYIQIVRNGNATKSGYGSLYVYVNQSGVHLLQLQSLGGHNRVNNRKLHV